MTGLLLPAAKWLGFASLALAGGLLAFRLLLPEMRNGASARGESAALRLAAWLAAALVLALCVLFVARAAVLLNDASQALRPESWMRLVAGTRLGRIWAVQLAIAVALLAFLAFGARLRPGARGRLYHASGWALALAAAWAGMLAGHAAAVEPAWLAVVLYGAHWTAAGAWAGGLAALVMQLRAFGRAADPAGGQSTLTAFARFSTLALGAVLVLAASGTVMAYLQTARLPVFLRPDSRLGDALGFLASPAAPLLGTPWGHAFLVKLALIAAAIAIAARVRYYWLPRLIRSAAPEQVALTRAATLVAAELALIVAVLAAAAFVTESVPAAHDAISWPLAFRFSVDATWDSAVVRWRVCTGGALALAGLAFLAHTTRRALNGAQRWRRRIVVAAAAAFIGAAIALPPLAVVAYPDTYRRIDVAYQAVSISKGALLYLPHCVGCHGVEGHGDGSAAAGLPKRPADLTQPHTALHTAGDMYWWLTHGIPQSGMPGFADAFSEQDRWDVVNFLRAFSESHQGRILGSRVVPRRPWLGAPDFSVESGGMGVVALSDFRGRSPVLIVLFTAEARSLQRLGRIAAHYGERTQAAGAEVIAVPLDAAAEAAAGRLHAPVRLVSDGWEEIARTYSLFARTLRNPSLVVGELRARHTEWLVDRFGYLRARWVPAEEAPGWEDLNALDRQIGELGREPRILPPPGGHIH